MIGIRPAELTGADQGRSLLPDGQAGRAVQAARSAKVLSTGNADV